jgi:glycosyltransferase involved in cell wall biosynthesis
VKQLRPLRIGLIASSRFPIAQPFVGGLEAHIWALARALTGRGHQVTLFAAEGSDPSVAHRVVAFSDLGAGSHGRRDVSENRELVEAENLAYRRVMAGLITDGGTRLDVLHNHSLHPSPLAAVRRLGVPMISTFHTPPLPRLAKVLARETASNLCLVAVSRHAAQSWAAVAGEVHVVHNGVDTNDWPAGPGGGRAVWFGRLVPEKGAELAIDAARLAGRALDLAGPVVDEHYFRTEIEPRLGPDVRYLGHLEHSELARVVGRAEVALVTPRWDEPYGLVVAEALACGTPVAAFARGGIPEIVDARVGRLAPADDVTALATALRQAAGLDRREVRRHAEEHCSMTRMVGAYEDIYRSHVRERAVSRPHGVTVMRHTHDSGSRPGHDPAVRQGHDTAVRHGPDDPVRIGLDRPAPHGLGVSVGST